MLMQLTGCEAWLTDCAGGPDTQEDATFLDCWYALLKGVVRGLQVC